MKVSIITAGRNDNYGGDFRGRTLTATEYNQAQAERHGIDVEWLFVEWNPLDENYLSYELAAKYGYTCYVVAPEIHAKRVHPDVAGRMTFCQFLAVNVGLRRATGDWLLCTHPDDAIGPDVWQRLNQPLDIETIYRARRYDVPAGHFGQSWQEMTARRGLDHGGGYTNAAGDFLLFSAEYRRGFDEWAASFSDVHTDGRFVCSWMRERTGDIHWNTRYCQFIGTIYKCDHPMIYRRSGGAHRGKPKWKSKERRTRSGRGLYDNPPDWGLASEPVRQLVEGVWYIG